MSKQTEAADELEALTGAMKEIVILLRQGSGQSPDKAYALVYELRKRIGYVVANLGVGAPLSASSKYAADIIDSYGN